MTAANQLQHAPCILSASVTRPVLLLWRNTLICFGWICFFYLGCTEIKLLATRSSLPKYESSPSASAETQKPNHSALFPFTLQPQGTKWWKMIDWCLNQFCAVQDFMYGSLLLPKKKSKWKYKSRFIRFKHQSISSHLLEIIRKCLTGFKKGTFFILTIWIFVSSNLFRRCKRLFCVKWNLYCAWSITGILSAKCF